ncbi:hypothetical protein [Rhodoferax sp. OV413]|uniref:hypothetical protein n=1 Tax=Rhodoferax sp. OV413 TaxID=1855285 RepID=UPI000B863564|nr:hypothetical protein [Rhodoferax sp. OV413]
MSADYGVSPGIRAADPLVAQPSVASPGVSTLFESHEADMAALRASMREAEWHLARALCLSLGKAFGSEFVNDLGVARDRVIKLRAEYGL